MWALAPAQKYCFTLIIPRVAEGAPKDPENDSITMPHQRVLSMNCVAQNLVYRAAGSGLMFNLGHCQKTFHRLIC